MGEAELRATVEAFHDLHEETHTYAARDEEPVLRAVRVQAVGRTPKPPRAGLVEQFGDVAIKFAAEAKDMLNLVADAVYWTVLAPFERRGFRGDLFLDELHEMGVRAVKINALMNFLLGLTIAMMSGAQLRSFGLDLYVADLVMIAFARSAATLSAVAPQPCSYLRNNSSRPGFTTITGRPKDRRSYPRAITCSTYGARCAGEDHRAPRIGTLPWSRGSDRDIDQLAVTRIDRGASAQ